MAVATVRPQQLLGEDGRGYDLARRLEACGAWRVWLGDSAYAVFVHSLSSPAAWEAFMRSDDAAAKTRSQILLQIRTRALLFDKASVSLFPDGVCSPSPSISNINPAYLQLHADDVYFSLEDDAREAVQRRDSSAAAPSRLPQATPRSAHSSYYDRNPSSGNEYTAQRAKPDELPETWYSQCADKLKKAKPWRPPPGDRDLHKRTPDGMSAYLNLLESHKRKRRFLVDESRPLDNGGSRSLHNSSEEDTILLPEIMFPSNCVPESALPPPRALEKTQKFESCSVLDSLPNFICQNPAMVERFGIRPEYVKVEHARSKYRGKQGPEGSKKLSPEQASQLSQKVIARILGGIGLEGGTQVSIEILSKFMASHASKLGRTLKLLSDSYRRQCSSLELLKMFARTAGISFSSLADHMKTHQHARGAHQTHQNYLHQQQRPIQGQMNSNYSQNMAFQQQQQQLLQLRRCQTSLPRVNSMPMVEVKMESAVDAATDLPRQTPQFRGQQILSSPAHQFRSMSSPVQISSAPPSRIQSQSSFGRAAPVKVEGFEELMGGGSPPLKHDEQQHRLTSPSK